MHWWSKGQKNEAIKIGEYLCTPLKASCNTLVFRLLQNGYFSSCFTAGFNNEIFQVIQCFGQVEWLTAEYSLFRFIYTSETEVKGLFQSFGDKDKRSGFPLIIKKLPGKLKRYGELSHTINPQALFGLRDEIDLGFIRCNSIADRLGYLQKCKFQQVNFWFKE